MKLKQHLVLTGIVGVCLLCTDVDNRSASASATESPASGALSLAAQAQLADMLAAEQSRHYAEVLQREQADAKAHGVKVPGRASEPFDKVVAQLQPDIGKLIWYRRELRRLSATATAAERSTLEQVLREQKAAFDERAVEVSRRWCLYSMRTSGSFGQ
jgi:hypothetical protein